MVTDNIRTMQKKIPEPSYIKVKCAHKGRNMDIETLIARTKDGDPESFAVLMQGYTGDMYRIALAILANDDDAADAIQETCLTCWEKIGKLRKPEYFKTWMIRILINHSYDILRRNSRYALTDNAEELSSRTTEGPQDYLELKKALAILDQKYRLPVVLYYFEGYKTSEITKILKIPQNTVLTRLRRGKEILK